MSVHKDVCSLPKGTRGVWAPHCAPCSISLPPFTFPGRESKVPPCPLHPPLAAASAQQGFLPGNPPPGVPWGPAEMSGVEQMAPAHRSNRPTPGTVPVQQPRLEMPRCHGKVGMCSGLWAAPAAPAAHPRGQTGSSDLYPWPAMSPCARHQPGVGGIHPCPQTPGPPSTRCLQEPCRQLWQP